MYQLTAAKSRALAPTKGCSSIARFLICRVALLLEQLASVKKERKERGKNERKGKGRKKERRMEKATIGRVGRKLEKARASAFPPFRSRIGELPSLTPWIVERSRPLLIPLHGWRAPREQVNQW